MRFVSDLSPDEKRVHGCQTLRKIANATHLQSLDETTQHPHLFNASVVYASIGKRKTSSSVIMPPFLQYHRTSTAPLRQASAWFSLQGWYDRETGWHLSKLNMTDVEKFRRNFYGRDTARKKKVLQTRTP